MQSELEDGRVVITLTGEIDLATGDVLEAQMERAIQGAADIVIDLSAVEFIDSGGLRLLKRTSTAATGQNATLSVVAPPNSIARNVLDLTRMSDELTVQDSLDDATGTTLAGETRG